MAEIPNYPDVFGAITDVPRHQAGVVQVALTVRPPVVQAGRPFEVIMLVQNLVDAAVDVSVVLSFPDKDAEGKKGRFITSKERLVVGVQPAEVGYITLQMSTLPDTTPGKAYTVGMEVTSKSLVKNPPPIRLPEGGGSFDLKAHSEKKQQEILRLQRLPFSTNKRGGFLRNTILETTFSLRPGKVGTPLNLQPGWTPLWTVDDLHDTGFLLKKYREAVRLRVMPSLHRKNVYKLLLEKTEQRFKKAGYPLQSLEAPAIAKLMTLVLEYANVSSTAQDIVEAGIYNIDPVMRSDYVPPEDGNINLPRWTQALLKAIARDERIAGVAPKAIPHVAYDALLYDAVRHGFFLIERATGEDLGSEEEIADYAETVVKKLSSSGELNFGFVYMPLVTGGIITFDRVLMEDDKLAEITGELKYMIEDREGEMNEENEMIFQISQRILTQMLKKYGSLDSRNR